jgi:hypothetical protein
MTSSSSEAPHEPRSESGERRVVALSDMQATRVTEKFRLPDEALPSEPPPRLENAPSEVASPPGIKATTRVAVPESLKLLGATVPTPHVVTPKAAKPASSAPEPLASSVPDLNVVEPRKPQSRMHAVVTAIAIFVLLASAGIIGWRLAPLH